MWNTILSCCVHEDLVGLGRRLNLTRLDDHPGQPVKRSSFVPPDPQDPTRGRDKVELVNTSLLRRLLSGPWHCPAAGSTILCFSNQIRSDLLLLVWGGKYDLLRYFRIVIGVCYDEAGHRLIKHPDDSVQTLILSTIRRVFLKATSWDHWNKSKIQFDDWRTLDISAADTDEMESKVVMITQIQGRDQIAARTMSIMLGWANLVRANQAFDLLQVLW